MHAGLLHGLLRQNLSNDGQICTHVCIEQATLTEVSFQCIDELVHVLRLKFPQRINEQVDLPECSSRALAPSKCTGYFRGGGYKV